MSVRFLEFDCVLKVMDIKLKLNDMGENLCCERWKELSFDVRRMMAEQSERMAWTLPLWVGS